MIKLDLRKSLLLTLTLLTQLTYTEQLGSNSSRDFLMNFPQMEELLNKIQGQENTLVASSNTGGSGINTSTS